VSTESTGGAEIEKIMLGKIKFRKIAVVVFLTALIWIWADLALDQEEHFPGATLTIGMSRPSLWISFRGEPTVDINDIVLKGSVSNISQVKNLINNDPDKLKFTLEPEQLDLIEPGEHRQEVRDIIRQSIWIKEMGLTVVSCEPKVVDVNVVELVKKDLTVICRDQNGNIREPETINPQKVSMNVPQDWAGTRLAAYVDMTPGELQNARTREIEKIPYISLGGIRRQAVSTVKIKMPPKEELYESYPVANPTLGYGYSPNLEGYWVAEVINLNEVKNISIRGTLEAKQAYEHELFQVILPIADSDIDKIEEGQTIKREVIYLFPEDFVERGEIKLDSPRDTAEFRLKRVSPAENP
jgi:hypothetical protein